MSTPTVDGPPVRSLERNPRGRDLVFGDIHGQREVFERLLDEVGYAPGDGDRLLLLGDVVDRGPDSAGMLEWLHREGVWCIRGNHEQMMLDALEGDSETEGLWTEVNGGHWSWALDGNQREQWREVLGRMPLAIEVEGGQGTFVMVHAEVPQGLPWWALKAWLEEGDRRAALQALWSRVRIWNKFDAGVEDVWRTFHGHVPLRRLRQVGNMRWIDAGAAYPRRFPDASLACVPINQHGFEEEPVLARVLDVDPSQAP